VMRNYEGSKDIDKGNGLLSGEEVRDVSGDIACPTEDMRRRSRPSCSAKFLQGRRNTLAPQIVKYEKDKLTLPFCSFHRFLVDCAVNPP
jgi:hypothetical protein